MVDRGMREGSDFGEGKKVEGEKIGDGVVYGLREGSEVNVNEVRIRGV
ncbi:hypothetical protein [Staphylococcus epidermidis]